MSTTPDSIASPTVSSLTGVEKAPVVLHVSIVIPVYRGENTIEAVVSELEPLTRPQVTSGGLVFRIAEIILVHDGAVDNSAAVIQQLANRYPFVTAIWLSRNFGQHPATLAGMASTTSEWVVTMDEDGQQDPADIAKLLDAAVSNQCQLIYAEPTNRAPHGFLRNWASRTTKWVFVFLLSTGPVSRFNSFRLIEGEIARSLAAYCGHNVYLDVALSWVVCASMTCPLRVREERGRPSGYSFRKLLGHFWRFVLTSGTKPLRLISLLGVSSILLGLVVSLYAVYGKWTGQVPIQGWTSLIIVMCIFCGAILFSLGLIAEYLGMALTAAMGKPPYLVVSHPVRRKAPNP